MLLLPLLGLVTAVWGQDPPEDVVQLAADSPLEPYVVPNQKVEEFIALGDSYTAGTGSNGRPEIISGGESLRGRRSYPMQMSQDMDHWKFVNHGDQTLPRFSFHAFTGDTTVELSTQQLNQGEYKDDLGQPRGQPFGKPQVAVMTIGGNDAHLGNILNDCIYLGWKPNDCQGTLDQLQREIDDGSLQDKISVAIQHVVRAGRQAGGANPPNSFQTYILEYVTFFDDAYTERCDNYSWQLWYMKPLPWRRLTQDLRKRLNDLVLKVNQVIKTAAKDLEAAGVIYVEGLQDRYKGHRFCEPDTEDQYEKSAKIWFWSRFVDTGSPWEGPGDPGEHAAEQAIDPAQQILDFVFPGQNKDAKQLGDKAPWELEGAEKYPDFESLMKAMTAAAATAKDDAAAAGLNLVPLSITRSFHPKGTAYKEHADLLFAAMANNRPASTSGGGGGGGNPGPGPKQPEQGLKCAGIANSNFIGRDDMADKIKKFCSEAAKQGVQDKDSGSTVRKYNGDSRWEVDLRMTWPSGTDITKEMEAKCLDRMNVIMDSCDGNDPKNPLNWKHGGTLGDGVVEYSILPKKSQGYKPGKCSMKLHQHENYDGNDGPGTRRDHTYYVQQLQMTDTDGTEIGKAGFKDNSQDAAPIECGDGKPFMWKTALPNEMGITPEAVNDYIQFTNGPISWPSSQSEGAAGCKVELWNTQQDPVFGENEIPHSGSQDRGMECWFPC